MDVTFVSSEHSKNIFEQVTFEKKDKETGQTVGKIELTKPVEVLFEGVNVDTYKVLKDFKSNSINLLEMKESFAFLHCGMWLQGNLGEDRKDIGMMIKVFLETFKNKVKQPALLLKVTQGTSSYMGRDAILDKIEKIKATVKSNLLPNIYLLNGDLSDKEMNELYNHPKVKAMVSFTKGEGFGRPLLEFSAVGKPIIASNWSGHTDFLHEEYTSLIGGELTPIHPSAANKWLLKEACWFTIDYPSAGGHLRDIFKDYKKYQIRAKRQAAISTQEFSYDAMKDLLGERLELLVPKLAKAIELKLPRLLKLPKLK
jgi:glycosyltransferase involved in cell wall biosynthesis